MYYKIAHGRTNEPHLQLVLFQDPVFIDHSVLVPLEAGQDRDIPKKCFYEDMAQELANNMYNKMVSLSGGRF